MNITNFVNTILQRRRLNPTKKLGKAYAPTNIALAKYWGKRDNTLNLPFTSSLSISVPNKGASTSIEVIDTTEDKVIFNNKILSNCHPFASRISNFLDLFRPKPSVHFCVKTEMNIPAGAGLASSACGFAALVLALDDLFDWQLDKKDLSMLARLGSGSAARSLWSGFVKWHAGSRDDGLDSYAEALQERWDNLLIGIVLVSEEEKSIGSTKAMQQTVDTSPYYKAWQEQTKQDLESIELAIKNKDFELLGTTAESNALAMHATMLAARPPILYSEPASIDAIKKIWALRNEGVQVYFTQDAGPNIKLLFLKETAPQIQQAFPQVKC